MCIATMKTVTLAMRARAALEGYGIRAEIVSLDPSLTSRGCAYGISFPCPSQSEVLRILAEKKISYGQLLGGGNV